jgi:hypothetical protein
MSRGPGAAPAAKLTDKLRLVALGDLRGLSQRTRRCDDCIRIPRKAPAGRHCIGQPGTQPQLKHAAGPGVRPVSAAFPGAAISNEAAAGQVTS